MDLKLKLLKHKAIKTTENQKKKEKKETLWQLKQLMMFEAALEKHCHRFTWSLSYHFYCDSFKKEMMDVNGYRFRKRWNDIRTLVSVIFASEHVWVVS